MSGNIFASGIRRSLQLAVALTALSLAAPAQANPIRVQQPAKTKVSGTHIDKIRTGREKKVNASTTALGKSLVRGNRSLTTAAARKAISEAPLAARLVAFKEAAKAKRKSVQTFNRRLRGMLINGKKKSALSSSKTFFEVLPGTLNLFRETMGENVIWFASAESPGHLHTLLADQNGGKNLTHNVYGATMGQADVPREQYLAPVVLDKAQMARFTKYLNAGVKAGFGNRSTVYGFKTSSGETVYQTSCTNWATSAPVGDLHGWVQKVDVAVIKAHKDGKLPAQFKDGLHAALAKATTEEAREQIVNEVVNSRIAKMHRAGVRKLGKEFDETLTAHRNRPAELVGRQSLSEVVGVSRSRDPAKWMYDLMLSKNTPIVGVLRETKKTNFSKMVFDLGIMGQFNAKGDTIKGGQQGLGVIPRD